MRSLSFFCQRREGSPGEEKVLRHRQTDCLHLAWISLPLTPLCPPCTAHPNGIIMTSSGVNWEAGRGLIQTKVLYASVGVGSSDRCLCCNYQLSCLFPNSPSTPTPTPIPCPIPFSFINSNPPHPLLATIFFLSGCVCFLLRALAKAAAAVLKCFGNGYVMAVGGSGQTAVIYSSSLERSH